MAVDLQTHPTQSLLYRAAFTARPVSQTPIDPNVLFYKYKVKDIIGFILKIKPQGVTFEELRRYPSNNLNALNAELLKFFSSDIRHFNRFASIYPDYDKLSADDFRVAARLANQMVDADSKSPSPTKTVRAQETVANDFFAPEIDPFMPSVMAPSSSIKFDDDDRFTPSSPIVNSPNHDLPFAPHNMPQQPVRFDVNQTENSRPIPRPTDAWMATPANGEPSEAVKALVARNLPPDARPVLIWRPTDNDPHLDAADGTISSLFHTHKPFENAGINQSWRVSVKELTDLLRHIDQQGEVSLTALRAYKPVNKQEIAMLQFLRQMDVFQALAHLNESHDNKLDFNDIKIMANRHMLVLSDAHLSVFIVD